MPSTFPENDEIVRRVEKAIEYISFHARTTLHPLQGRADRYTQLVDLTVQEVDALHALYVKGRPVGEIADGSMSRSRQVDMQKRGLEELKHLLAGDPHEGWMDGAPIDNLRRACLPFLSEADATRYNYVLELRSYMAEATYTVGETLIHLLPLSADVKKILGRSDIWRVGQIPPDLLIIRGLGPAARTELGIVLNALTSPYDPHRYVNDLWLGVENQPD